MSELSALLPFVSPLALLVSAAGTWLLMRSRQEFAAKPAVDAIAAKVADFDVRMARAEVTLAAVPTTGEITALSLAIAQLRGDLKAFDVSINSLKELVERHELRVDRHEEILSEAGRRHLEDRRGQ